MSRNEAVAKVELEAARFADARHALELRARGVNPLFLVGGALLAGLVAGRVIPRVHVPRSLAPPTLLATAIARPLSGLLEALFAKLISLASDDSKSDSPPGTQSRAP